MPVSPSGIDALNKAIANPEKQVGLNWQQVVYRSVAELICARDALIKQMTEEQAAMRRSSLLAYGYRRGHGC